MTSMLASRGGGAGCPLYTDSAVRASPGGERQWGVPWGTRVKLQDGLAAPDAGRPHNPNRRQETFRQPRPLFIRGGSPKGRWATPGKLSTVSLVGHGCAVDEDRASPSILALEVPVGYR